MLHTTWPQVLWDFSFVIFPQIHICSFFKKKKNSTTFFSCTIIHLFAERSDYPIKQEQSKLVEATLHINWSFFCKHEKRRGILLAAKDGILLGSCCQYWNYLLQNRYVLLGHHCQSQVSGFCLWFHDLLSQWRLTFFHRRDQGNL